MGSLGSSEAWHPNGDKPPNRNGATGNRRGLAPQCELLRQLDTLLHAAARSVKLQAMTLPRLWAGVAGPAHQLDLDSMHAQLFIFILHIMPPAVGL